MRVPAYFRTLLLVHSLEVKVSKLKEETGKYCKYYIDTFGNFFRSYKICPGSKLFHIRIIILHLWLSIKIFCYSMTTYVPLNALLNESINRESY